VSHAQCVCEQFIEPDQKLSIMGMIEKMLHESDLMMISFIKNWRKKWKKEVYQFTALKMKML
jgi:hypothetical protein